MKINKKISELLCLITFFSFYLFFPKNIVHAATTYSVTQLKTTVNGTSVTATTTIKASSNITAQYAGTCARDTNGNNFDFPKKSNIKITTTGTTITASETFAPGTYSYFACLDVNGTWYTPGSTQYVTVGGTTPTPMVVPTAIPTATPSIPTPTPTPMSTYSINGTVYVDANQNGVQDTGETGYNSATVILNTGQSTITNANGNYSFPNLVAGSYVETLTVPNGYATTTTNPVITPLTASTTVNFGIASIPTSTPTPTIAPTTIPTAIPTVLPTATPTPTTIPTLTPTIAGPIMQDSVGTVQQKSSITSVSWNHTVGNFTNRILVVGVSVNGSKTVSSVTYGSQNLTRLDKISYGSGAQNDELWYIINPPVGTATIKVTLSGSTNIVADSVSFYNVNQGTPFGTDAKASGNGTTATMNVPSGSNQLILDMLGSDTIKGTFFATTGQTTLWSGYTNTPQSGASTKPSSGATTTMTWTDISGDNWGEIGVALLPVGTSPTPTPTVTPTPTITPTVTPTVTTSPTPTPTDSPTPLGGASHAGSLVENYTGSQMTSWNVTSTFCPEQTWNVPDGIVTTDSDGNVALTTTGNPGSCVALESPNAYSSGVIEAYVDLPALPGSPNTIANWTSFWITDDATWPVDGELDAIEAEPVNGINAVSWHSGTSYTSPFVASTDGFFPNTLPIEGPNLTPGWHTLDIVYTKGFFAVYYDGQQYTSYTSNNVTGSPLNIYITTGVTPNTSTIQQVIGGPPVNSDSSPATYAVKYLKVWSYK